MVKEKTFSQSNVALWGAVLLLFGLIIRVLLLEAPLQSDDTTYLSIAKFYSAQFLQKANNQLPFRAGMILPLMLLQKMFGYSIVAYYAFSIFFYLLMLFSIYLVSIIAFGLPAGIASLCIATSSSLILVQSSNVLPDVPNLAFMLISFAVFLLAERKNNGKNNGWVITLLIALSAMAGFWAYLVREANVVFLVCIPLYEVLKNRSIRKTMLFGMFFLLFVALEMSYYWAMTGDPLRRFAMATQGVNSWSIYQPVISLGQYLFEPFTNFTKWKTGWFLLLGGVLGFVIALFKKNWAMVSIVAGAMLLFIFYSYSATSLSPIKRALPLQIRYVLTFSVIMAMCAGYTVAFIGSLARLSWRGSSFPLVGFLMLGAIVCLQVAELPRAISGAILNGNDSYFIADRLLRDKLKDVPISVPVYAHPSRDFKMYPHFSKYNLKTLDTSAPPVVGQTILFSKSRMKKDLTYAIERGDTVIASTAEIYLNRFHPNWEILLDTEDIILAKVIAF